MTLLLLCCLWVLSATAVALLPIRYQYAPGLALVAALPVLLYMIGRQLGLWAVLFAILASVSMFRKPLRALARYLLGRVSGVSR